MSAAEQNLIPYRGASLENARRTRRKNAIPTVQS
jgi:hypothetical protein